MYLQKAIEQLADEIHARIADDLSGALSTSHTQIAVAPEKAAPWVAELYRLYAERYREECLVYEKQENGRFKQVSPEDYPPRPFMMGFALGHTDLLVREHIRQCWLQGSIVIRGREWNRRGHFWDDQDRYARPAEDIKPHDDMHFSFEGRANE